MVKMLTFDKNDYMYMYVGTALSVIKVLSGLIQCRPTFPLDSNTRIIWSVQTAYSRNDEIVLKTSHNLSSSERKAAFT